MKADLSRRIIQLVSNAEDLTPADLKAEILDLAKRCQVVPKNRFLLEMVCEEMLRPVLAAFGPLAMLLVMTERKRRQVYFAVLARLETDGKFANGRITHAQRAELLTLLVTANDRTLINYAYGCCPSGFVRLIGRLGECGRKPEIYVQLFEILNDNPELDRELMAACQRKNLSDDLITLMRELPRTSLGVRAAAKLGTVSEYEHFIKAYEALTGSRHLADEHIKRMADGEQPSNILTKCYLEHDFPQRVLDHPDFVHIPDGNALLHAARKFSNCLDQYIAEALNNERQFYIWRKPEAPEVVFAIDSEMPFGWRLSESRLIENIRLPRELKLELEALLEAQGIRTGRSVEGIMHGYLANVRQPDFDDLFDLDIAA